MLKQGDMRLCQEYDPDLAYAKNFSERIATSKETDAIDGKLQFISEGFNDHRSEDQISSRRYGSKHNVSQVPRCESSQIDMDMGASLYIYFFWLKSQMGNRTP